MFLMSIITQNNNGSTQVQFLQTIGASEHSTDCIQSSCLCVVLGERAWLMNKAGGCTHCSRRVWMSGQESCSCVSEYMRKRILRLQARLLVSCFRRFGFDFPLKPTCKIIKDTHHKKKTVSYKWQHYHNPDEEIKECGPAFQSAVLCSLLELKSLANLWDSRRQSSSLKRCCDDRCLYMPWSAAVSPSSACSSASRYWETIHLNLACSNYAMVSTP